MKVFVDHHEGFDLVLDRYNSIWVTSAQQRLWTSGNNAFIINGHRTYPLTYYTRKNFGILSSWYDGKGDVIHLMFPCCKERYSW